MTRDTPSTTDAPHDDQHPRLHRRPLLRAGGFAAIVGLSGCSALPTRGCTHATDPDPIALDGGQQCDECGMVIDQHPGPVGQIFYCDNEPRDHPNPAWFDALNPCLFEYHFAKEEAGWSPTAVFVTDYSTVDWSVYEEGGDRFLSAHYEAAAFGDGRTATYVARPDVRGAMGTALVPFSERADAASFRDEYGGELLAFEDVTPAVLRG